MAKRKGDEFERETTVLAGKNTSGIPYGKKTPKSGAYGTVMGVQVMAGDTQWRFPWLNDIISIECKHGYQADYKADQKSMTIKKEWFDKHLEQCKSMDLLPAWSMKFKFTTENGMSKFLVIPFKTARSIIDQMDNLYIEMEELREELRMLKDGTDSTGR